MTSETSPDSKQGLAAVLDTIDAQENAEKEILRYLIARASETDAKWGEVIRSCAIPRRFDAEIVGVLRDRPAEREINEHLLAKLLNFSFARTLPDGGYAYHDSTRDLILEEWRRPERREQFDQINQQLVSFYKSQHENIARLEQDLSYVARVVQDASPPRYVQLTSILETRIVRPLLEALYHKSLQSAEACYKYFERLYQDQEKAGRLMARESLLNAARDYLERLPTGSGQERWLRWLQYWKGRLKSEVRQNSEAERILLELLPQTDDDVTLKLWVLGDLGVTYYSQGRLTEARDTYQKVLDLATETGNDPYNLPVWYSRLAQLHWSLDELVKAEEEYREAIKHARGTNVGLELSSRIDLTGVLYARGRLSEALNNIIDTLHFARSNAPSDRSSHRAIIEALMNLIARRDPQLLDTIFAEADASMAESNDPVGRLKFRLQYSSLLRQSGQLRRANEDLPALLDSAVEYSNEVIENDLLLEKAFLRDDQGQIENAIDLYSQFARRAAEQEAAWNHAAALSNRGILEAKIARWREAETDLREAIGKWHQMGHDKLEAFIHGSLATALRQQGRLEKAQESLDRALSIFGASQSGYVNELYQEQGEVYQAQGRKEEAHKQFALALDGYSSLDQFKSAARAFGSLETLAAEEGNWEEAARCAAESNKLWQELARLNSYCPTEAAQRADEQNASGVQAFFSTEDDRLERISKSREFFRSAIKQVPDNFWYRLNLAYACAELEDWSEAAQAVRDALERSPEWLRAQMLYERLAEYRAKEGERIFSASQYEEAARFYAESRDQLKGHVEFGRLAEVQLRLSDSLMELGRTADAREAYELGLSHAKNADNAMVQATFHARLGLLEALQADLSQPHLSKVLEHFRASINLLAQAGQTEVVEELVSSVDEFSDLIASIAQYRVLGEALRALTDDPLIEAASRQRLIDAQFDLSRARYQATRRPAGESVRITTGVDPFMVIPILLEADGTLFPLDEKTPQVDRMIHVDIPAMRQELLYRATGVTVPGVRIRANDDLKEGRYVLSLDEIPIERGVVFATDKFCPNAARCQELGIEGLVAPNPGERADGMWLPEAAWRRAESDGLQLQDPYQYMIIHLGALLRRRLASFLGVQEVQNMLTQWVAKSEDRQELFERAVPDDAATVRLAQVLRHLVKEEVSILNLSTILATFAEVNSTLPELIDVIESVRGALRSDLPVSKGGRNLIGLSEDFETAIESAIQQQDHKRFLAMPKEKAENLINQLQRHIADRADNLVLVVARSDLRPFVWRLLRGVYPYLLVSSASELPEGTTLPDERINLSAENAMLGARDVSSPQEPIELEVNKETSHPEQSFLQRFINRQVEQELFAQLLQFKDESRLLIIKDKAGTGKTALLKMFEYRCRYSHTTAVSYISLEESTLNDPFNLVLKIRRELFNLTFVRFDRLDLARVTRDFSAFSAESEPLVTANPPAQIVARAADWGFEQEEFARLECINAFLADLEIISGKEPAAVLLDSFERSDPKLREWIVSFLIPRLFGASQHRTRLVLVLAGRELPDFMPIFGSRYHQVVRSIGRLSAWSAQDIEAFLRAEGYGTLGDKDLSRLLDKVNDGIPLADTLQMARLMASGRLP